jgi:hypothetical protein
MKEKGEMIAGTAEPFSFSEENATLYCTNYQHFIYLFFKKSCVVDLEPRIRQQEK